MKYTQQEIQEKYKTLPEELKNAIFSVESADIIQVVSRKYGLHIDQMGELASETGYVLLGFTKPENYIKNLKDRLQIDSQNAKDIALEINSQIFSKVKDFLKLHYEKDYIEPKIEPKKNVSVENISLNNQISLSPKLNSYEQETKKIPLPLPPQELLKPFSPNQNKNILPEIPENKIPIMEQEKIKTNYNSPLELLKKHEADKKLENQFSIIKDKNKEIPSEETLNFISNNIKKEDFPSPLINVMPDLKDINKIQNQEIKNKISRQTKQTIELNILGKNENNEDLFKNKNYPQGDPYKESI